MGESKGKSEGGEEGGKGKARVRREGRRCCQTEERSSSTASLQQSEPAFGIVSMGAVRMEETGANHLERRGKSAATATANVSLLGGLKHGHITGNDRIVGRELRVARTHGSANCSRVARHTAQRLDLQKMRVVRRSHAGRNGFVIPVIRGATGQLRTAGAVRVRARGGPEVFTKVNVQLS